jgi:hypothetical protein
VTDIVPTVVPPLVQLLGGVGCGPKTVKVIVPLAPPVAPVRTELIAPGPIDVPAVPLAGPIAVREALAGCTAVESMPLPQVVAAGLSLESPL